MRRGLGVGDLGDLVERPLLAVLATYRRDGTVLLSPVWHEWRGSGFNIVTTHNGIKAGHLRRDPRAGLVVCEGSPMLGHCHVGKLLPGRTVTDFFFKKTRVQSVLVGVVLD